jgi:acyl-CoA synthetase (AMP-forming)/AMP-acid ligase II/acyl carrier protein
MQHNKAHLINYLLDHSLTSPLKTAFIIVEDGERAEKRISYQELASRVMALAARLHDRQLAGKRVLLVYQDILEFIIAFLACQHAGITPVPVSYVKGNKQIARLLNIIDDAHVSAIFCAEYSIAHLQRGLQSFLEQGKMEIFATDADHAGNPFQPGERPGLYQMPGLHQKPELIQKPAIHEIAFIQYTSGSTGKPKGVVITGRNLLHNQQLIKSAFGCDQSSVIFSWLPFHHDMGLIGNILHTLYVGCTCVLLSPFHFMQSPKRWLQGISDYKATHSGGPNFAYDLCVDKITPEELSSLDLSGWKVAYNGSEPVRTGTIQRFSHYFKPTGFKISSFCPCYGLAEATLLVSAHTNEKPPVTIHIERDLTAKGKFKMTDEGNATARSVVGSGKVAPGMKVKIVSLQEDRECGDLEEGEICIRGDSVTRGYWNKDNSDVFIDLAGKAFLKTGDLGFSYHGELFVHGRLKEMLIVRGRNFYPADVETVIHSCHTAIETNGVAVFSIDGEEEDIVIAAEIKRTRLKDLDVQNIISSIDKATHGSFGISPYDIVLTTPLAIPRTTSGKLQRIKCKDNYQSKNITVIGSKLGRSDKLLKREKDTLLLAEVLRHGHHDVIQAYLVDLIAYKTGIRMDMPVQDQVDLTELGLDSLRATELVNAVNKDLGINIDTTKILPDNTLYGLVNTIENMLWLKSKQPVGKEIFI